MSIDWSSVRSPLDRSREATEAEVDGGRLLPWVLDRVTGPAQRDHLNAVTDRRAAFRVIRGGRLIGNTTL